MDIIISNLYHHRHLVPQLSKLWHSVSRAYKPMPGTMTRRLKRHCHAMSMPTTYVCFVDGMAVGMCSLQFREDIIYNKGPWLATLVVEPEYRDRGLAKQLIARVERQAKFLGYDEIYLCTSNPTLVSFYNKLGWTVVSEIQYHEAPAKIMRKYLI